MNQLIAFLRSTRWSVFAGSLMFCSAFAQSAQAASIGFDPDNQSVANGSPVQVDIVFSDLGGEIISAYDLDVTYDASIISATGVVFASSLGDEFFFEVFNDFDLSTPGIVDLAQISLLSDSDLLAFQGGDSITAATLMFDTLGTGTTELGFVFNAFNDVKGSRGLVLDLDINGGSITVGSAIPEPSAALLFAVGALLLRPRRRT